MYVDKFTKTFMFLSWILVISTISIVSPSPTNFLLQPIRIKNTFIVLVVLAHTYNSFQFIQPWIGTIRFHENKKWIIITCCKKKNMISENKIITGLVWRNENSEPRTIRERIKLYYRVIQTTTYVFLENGFEFLRNAHLYVHGVEYPWKRS